MTQKAKVLSMLKAAGSFGVRSDTYIKDYMPRAAARIQELRDEGYEITSEREGKYTRWTLAGSSAGVLPQGREAATASVASSEAGGHASQAQAQGRPGEPGHASLPLFAETSYERMSDV